MAGKQLVGTNGRIDFTLDGLTFRRTKSAAASRGVGRLHHVGWDRIEHAEVTRSRKGKPILQVTVTDATVAPGDKHDPHAVKVKRSMAEEAHEFAAMVNHEIATRRRWEEARELSR